MSEPISIDVPDDQGRIYGDQLSLFCECDEPSPVIDPTRLNGDECAGCRKPLAR